MHGKSASARKTEAASHAHVHHGAHLANKPAKPAGPAAKAEGAASPVPPRPPPVASQTRPEPVRSAAADANTPSANVAEPHPSAGAANADTRMIEAQAAAARALAERTAAADPAPVPDSKASSKDSSNHPQTVARGDTEKTASASAEATDRLVCVLMVRPDVKSVSDLAGKTIAIDDRYSASNSSVRTAIVAAGAGEVQLSEGPTTAINRLVDGEVPAAVLALVAPEAAERFPAIAGFKTFQIPLSPRSLKARP
jgi:hypothetical protein